ncbi:uncharacterized protein LOC100201584 isoform X2 [Hydra vulgaris]|uniref:Uncharacterized protein LOC100201584 isoform X2 n=1 Tax=Hydra vulgaris TaxID=6087 RepID=A0ABM4DK03_HYDVU
MPKKITRKTQKNEVATLPIVNDENYSDAMKKASFLLDFDVRVENDIEEMKKYMEDVVSSLNRTFLRQKNLLKKEIRTMKVVDFLKMGGDLNTLDFTEVVRPLIEDPDISFQVSVQMDDTFKQPLPSLRKSTRKRAGQVAESPLVYDTVSVKGKPRKALPNSRSKPQLNPPFIVPKFDPKNPISIFREEKRGETLLSLNGSPVVPCRTSDPPSDNICLIELKKEQTILRGTLFDSMSPGSLVASRDRILQVVGAITSRLEDFDSKTNAENSKPGNGYK